MNVSPYLSAIQSLKGETPGEKYKNVHSIAAKIIENVEEKEKFIKTGNTDRVASALHPDLRILVGLKLQSKEAVVEALKSDDVTIIKLALGAKWFFKPSNDLVNINYFVEKLLPFVSVRTRLELIKTLANCLPVKQAESFHSKFAGLFGTDQALPLLFACSEDYIYDEILKRKIILSSRLLRDLYRKYPQLVIRYLRLINDNATKNWNKKSESYVSMGKLQEFLPTLVKNHAHEFVEFYQNIPTLSRTINLGSTRAEFFLKNVADSLVKNPTVFLEALPLKLVKSKLSKQQYSTMLQNLFPKNVNDLYDSAIVYRIKAYYPKEGGFELFREQYKKAYNKDLLEHKSLFDYETIYEVIPAEMRAECGRKFVNASVDKSEYWHRIFQLPPKESIPLLKEQIKKSTVLQREECLKYMIQSCNIYKSKEDLLEVLQYYNSRHENEQAPIFLEWLTCLSATFDNMDSLDQEHWQVVANIVQKAYIKGNLYTTNNYFIPEQVFGSMLRNVLKQFKIETVEESDNTFLNTIVNIILEYYCEYNRKWDFLTDVSEIQKICLNKFLTAVPQKYPETHAIWKKDNNKLMLTSYFVESMGKFNGKNLHTTLDSKVKASKIDIQHYPWLVIFVTDLLNHAEYNTSTWSEYSALKKSLKKYYPEFYQNLIDDHATMVNDVTTNDALIMLTRDRSKILNKANEYLSECKNMLQRGRKATRRFVMSLKWYQDIPLKFVEKSLEEIEQKGSVFILGILLEGQVLSKIIEPYLPKESKLDVDSDTAKKDYELVSAFPRALNYTNPPPPLEVLISLCKKDYLSLALQAFSSIAQRIPIDRVLTFAEHLTNNAIPVKKAGIRLVFQVAPKPEASEFMSKICKEEKNPGIREVLAKMVYNLFTQTPSDNSWQLMKEFIDDLVSDDKNIFNVLNKLKSVDMDYSADYILEIFKKIDSFSDEELNTKERSQLICSFLNEIGDKQVLNNLPENFVNEVAKKYLLECSLVFIFEIYLFSDERKFEDRLKVTMEILSEHLKRLGVPDSKRPRSYPAIKKIHKLFSDYNIFLYLEKNVNKEIAQRFVASILENTLLRENFEYFTKCNIYQIILNESDAKSFGLKCGKNVDDLIKIYNNEVVIEYYGNYLHWFVEQSSFKDKLFDIINGLMSHKVNYGVLIGLKLLSVWCVHRFDERYDKYIETVKNSDDLLTRSLLNNFLRDIY